MNITETKALDWLRREKGYDQLVFQSRKSPDFLAPDGIGYEVKKTRNGVLVFTDAQWESLSRHPAVKVVIFDGSDSPADVVDFDELPVPPSHWRGYRLVLVNLSYKSGRVSVSSGEILTCEEAAALLKVNREVLRRLSEADKVAGAFKIGKQWRYRRSELIGESK